MNQACLSIIGMDWRIKFVGKLLVGKGRSNSSDRITEEIIFDTSSNITNSSVDNVYFKYKNMYLFYCDYLLWIIQKLTVRLDEQERKYDFLYATEDSVPSYFEVSGCNKNDVKLAVKPLNICTQRFLCIYFEPAYRIRSSIDGARKEFEHLLSKVIATII